METVFLRLFNMSITAGWLVLAVVALRLLLKKAPKWLTCLLWALVGIRLVCPFSFESVLSLIPSAETVPVDSFFYEVPRINSGVVRVDMIVNPILSETLAPRQIDSVNPGRVVAYIAALVWVAGMLIMAAYAVVSTLRLRHRVREAVCLQGNLWQCDHIATPFILGVFRPRIYLPSALDDSELHSVVAHEEAHLRRRDHWWKPLGFLLLTVYWFNPLLWVAYILLCRDIEMACDERVVRDMTGEQRKGYSAALLACSAPRRLVSACPLAFGETGVKQRIKTILDYKKPTFWIVVTAIVACSVAAVCLLTNPRSPLPNKLSTDLDEYLSYVILDRYGADENNHDRFVCEEHTMFGTEEEDNRITAYGVVRSAVYTCNEGVLQDVGGGHYPVAITVERQEDGTYRLLEYWEPRDGTEYAPSIEEKFPRRYVNQALRHTDYSDIHNAGCIAQARRFFSMVEHPSSEAYRAYSYEGGPVALGPSFYLSNHSNECQFSMSALSSYLAVGEYRLTDTKLTLELEELTLVFARDGGVFLFDADASDPIPGKMMVGYMDEIPDGARFTQVIERGAITGTGAVTTLLGMNWLEEEKHKELCADLPEFGSTEFLPIFCMRSRAELDAFLQKYWPELFRDSGFGISAAVEDLATYDDAFFRDFVLLVVYYRNGSSSVSPQFDGISYVDTGTTLRVEVDVYEPWFHNDALGEWLITTGVSKDALVGVERVWAYVGQHLPTDHMIAYYTQGYSTAFDKEEPSENRRTFMTDEEEIRLRQIEERLVWTDREEDLVLEGYYSLYGDQKVYFSVDKGVLYDGQRVAVLDEEDARFLRYLYKPHG